MDIRDAGGTQRTATALHTDESAAFSPPIDESPFSGPITTGPIHPGFSLTGAIDGEPFDVSAHLAAPAAESRVDFDPVLGEPDTTAIPTTASGASAGPSAAASAVASESGPWSIEPNLRARGPAYAVLQECLVRQESATTRGRLARVLGNNPLHPDARSWYSGALGEIVVAHALAQLGEAWTVLHSVPVGPGAPDIDHLVLGPAGIFTVTTHNHSGKKIWIGGSTFLVNGYKQEHMRTSAHEAERAARLLSSVTGRPVTVTPLIVVVNPASVTTGRKRPRVAVVSSNTLLRWLMRRPRVMSERAVAHFSMFAEERSTWQQEPVAVHDTSDQLARFERLRLEVDAARQRSRLWLLTLGVGAILITPVAIAEIVRLILSFMVVPAV
ncbi:NERD domain-containing protein [Glaciihabitans sp. INWT7]|uniref:nuclease-related domain-containing protein n=1 Tax=Glaciihabitans sp. INWT7 TaxID=2596912 RepID=UPI00162847AE|nr:nuclease-related domain-containing protein [Glaciihabitans sp. INWT7]QNE46513.1 NERD domain-containing protein [Glaciihabitans sp. INWT7]